MNLEKGHLVNRAFRAVGGARVQPPARSVKLSAHAMNRPSDPSRKAPSNGVDRHGTKTAEGHAMRIRSVIVGTALILHSSVSWAAGPGGDLPSPTASEAPAIPPPPADALEDCNLGIQKQEAVVRAAKDEDWDREQAKLERLERERDMAFPRRSQAGQVGGVVLIVLGLATAAVGGVALGSGGSGSKDGFFPDLSGPTFGALVGIGATGVLLGALVTAVASQRVPKPRRGVSLMLSPTGVGLGGAF